VGYLGNSGIVDKLDSDIADKMGPDIADKMDPCMFLEDKVGMGMVD